MPPGSFQHLGKKARLGFKNAKDFEAMQAELREKIGYKPLENIEELHADSALFEAESLLNPKIRQPKVQKPKPATNIAPSTIGDDIVEQIRDLKASRKMDAKDRRSKWHKPDRKALRDLKRLQQETGAVHIDEWQGGYHETPAKERPLTLEEEMDLQFGDDATGFVGKD